LERDQVKRMRTLHLATATPTSLLRTTSPLCLLIFALSFALRAHTIVSGFTGRVTRGLETQAVADSLVRTGQFANPFRYETGPTAHVGPIYPLYLAALMRLFPDDRAYEIAKELLSAFAASIQYALLPLLAVGIGLPRRVGILAALLAIGTFVLLPRNRLEIQGSWEHVHAGLGLVGLCMLTSHILKGRRFTLPFSIAFGVSWGAYLLLIPSMAIVFPIWLVAGFALARSSGFFRFALLSTVFLLLTLAPWTTRNMIVIGSPVWGRDNLGLELYTDNNDCATPSFSGNMRSGCHNETHPNVNADEAQRVREMGEVAYNRQRMDDALGWIRSNPGRFTQLSLDRFLLFWFPLVRSPAASLPLWAISGLGFAGAILAFRANPMAAWLLGGALASYPIIYYFVQHLLRYRYPILWISFLLAAYALDRGWIFYRSVRGPERAETPSYSRHDPADRLRGSA
jgi:hypothetical protein